MILLNNPEAIALISQASKVTYNKAVDQCLAISRNGEITGGVIYTDYNYVSIQIHMAGFRPHWVDKSLLWVAFDYPFNKLKTKKLLAIVPAINEKVLAIDKHLGFTEETRVRDVFPEGDAVILSMYRDQCRWLRMKPPAVQFRMG